MKTQFEFKLLDFKTIKEISNSWTLDDYKNLLEIMEYGNVLELKDYDLKDMCLMYLADNKPEDAAMIVLNYVFGDRLNSGQKQNLAHEMQEEKMWEEYADISFHRDLFVVNQILNEAYEGTFPHPEALTFRFEVGTRDMQNFDIFSKDAKVILTRLIVQGMPDNTLIKRLYDDQLDTGSFAEANDIIWQMDKDTNGSNKLLFTLTSSLYWFKDLKFIDTFSASINVLQANIHNN